MPVHGPRLIGSARMISSILSFKTRLGRSRPGDARVSVMILAFVQFPARRFARRALVLAVMALASLAGARFARGESSVSQARELYETGLQSYRAGNYDDAIANLQASYQLVAAPGLLYDMAQAHRLKGDCADARSLYLQFLDRSPGGSVETIARSHLVEMETCVANGARVRAAASTPELATVTAPVDSAEAPAPIAPARPPSVGWVTLAAAPEAAPLRPPRLIRRRSALAFGAAALGLAATTGYFAWRADVMSNRVSSTFAPGMQWSAAGMDAQQSGRTSATLGIVTAIGALVSGGIALWLAKHE
jgi:hypothetical protein